MVILKAQEQFLNTNHSLELKMTDKADIHDFSKYTDSNTAGQSLEPLVTESFGQRLVASWQQSVMQPVLASSRLSKEGLTDACRERLKALGAHGLSMKLIAQSFGMNMDTFRDYVQANPEIEDRINEGRAMAVSVVMNETWDAALDKNDNARNQELARLHRIFKTEEVANGDPDSPDATHPSNGFTITVINKQSSNASANVEVSE